MNTPPKSEKFRTKPLGRPAAPDEPKLFAPAPEDDGFGDLQMNSDPAEKPPVLILGKDDEAAVAAVRAEGLSARQLRLARRVAIKNGIDAGSDFEAVVLLRAKGIDPFQRGNILQLVEQDSSVTAATRNLPSTENRAMQLPSLAVNSEVDRISAIRDMHRDIVRRRRRNFALLMIRLAFFVILPTIAAGIYFTKFATPLYATKAEFLIQQAESQGGALGGLSSMFRGTSMATSQDSIAVQSYLQSRDAMMRLDKELGFKAHFAQSRIDPLQRLAADATNEEAYKLFKRNVKISYDPTEGIVRMEVVAADPQTSLAFSQALLAYAEQRVDNLTQRIRDDQMKGARESYADAEKKVDAAEAQMMALQEKLGVLDPKAETSVVMGQVGELESLIRKNELELSQLLDNAKPNQARVDGVKGDISRLKQQVAELRSTMTEGTADNQSLAAMTGQMRIAETELQTRQQMLAQSLQQLETARIEANRQVRYLSLSVIPVAPDEATYPRKFENTALAFMIFAGIYLMLSLTASILREQVTS